MTDVLKYLEENRTGIQTNAARFFMQPIDDQSLEDVVSNLVGLVSGVKSGIGGKIPTNYPKPFYHILKVGFDRIREKGGNILIKKSSENEYRVMSEQEMSDFLEKSDTTRFTVVESRDGESFCIDVIE